MSELTVRDGVATAMSRIVVMIFVVAICLSGRARSAKADDTTARRCVAAAGKAQEHRDNGSYKAARAELLVCGREECPGAIRRDCVAWLLEVNAASPSIVVRARDSHTGQEHSNVSVAIDNEVVAKHLDGKPILIDPGPHVVRGVLMNNGGDKHTKNVVVEQKVLIQTGEKNRLIEMSFPPTSSSTPTAPSTEGSDAGRRGASAGGGPLPWILGGVGVAAIGTSTAFLAVALSERSDLKNEPCASTSTCRSDDIDSVNAKLLIADVAGAVGIAAIGVAAYLFLTSSSSSSSSPSRASTSSASAGRAVSRSFVWSPFQISGRF